MAKGSGTKKMPVKMAPKPVKMACGGAAKSRRGFPMTKPVPKSK